MLVLRRTDSPWVRAPVEALRGPGALTLGLCVFYELTRKFLGLAGPILSVLEPFYVAIVVTCLVWFLQRLIKLISIRVSRRYEGANSDEANVLITQITVLRHVLVFVVLIGGAAYALSGFEWVRKFGTAILASAGVAGVILGVAAQRVLGNFFSGLLLAITQPVKAGDAIIFEQDFGWIEEIGITYLVIRTWDLRRLIVPLAYLIDRPFQHWSRGSQQIIKPVVVHADYCIDVEAVRAELKAILEQTDLWDKAVPPLLQVTECTPTTIELRALCSAKNPADSWDLHCLVRERLVGFIRAQDEGRSLPRTRVLLAHVWGDLS
jgi:small-conductance mechanosensitive channel